MSASHGVDPLTVGSRVRAGRVPCDILAPSFPADRRANERAVDPWATRSRRGTRRHEPDFQRDAVEAGGVLDCRQDTSVKFSANATPAPGPRMDGAVETTCRP